MKLIDYQVQTNLMHKAIEIRDELEEHLMMYCVDRMVCDVTDKYRTVVTVTMRREMISSEEEKD